MKSVFKISLLAAAVVFAAGCQTEEKKNDAKMGVQASASAAVVLDNDDKKAAYAIGTSLAQYLKTNLEQQAASGLELDAQLVLRGVQDTFVDKSQMTPDEAQAALQALDERAAKIMAEKAKEKGEAAKKAGDDYRANFAKSEGAATTESGLMYKVAKMSEGEKPSATDTVVVHYKGSLVDGTQFDSSYDRNKPASFPLDRVIPGWTEGVQLMSVGSKFTFVIPPELAYGDQDSSVIPANSTLVFEVELLEIQKAKAADAASAPAAPKEAAPAEAAPAEAAPAQAAPAASQAAATE
ncbi:MAG: FKBP-type peptidyl-prolyl cis-trans isomerase [Vibrionaceae bacterium]